MFEFRNYKNHIMNMIGGKCKYDTDDYKKAHENMIKELAKDYAQRYNCSTVSIFENGKFTRNITVEN